jgi:hypothetical protein
LSRKGRRTSRAVDSGWGVFLAQRDPDVSIRTDLDQLGQLLEFRLSEAEIEVTLDEYPGGHTTNDEVPELLGYLKAAAAG